MQQQQRGSAMFAIQAAGVARHPSYPPVRSCCRHFITRSNPPPPPLHVCTHFITNFSIARQGFERMGFSACYDILLGIGISFTMATVASGEHRIYIQYGEVGPLLVFFLGLSLLSSLLAFPMMKFTARRYYGFYLLGLYCVFLISATLLEVGWFPSILMSAEPTLSTPTTVRSPT
ncbi:hypothetical protein B566_EDAN010350 [Ephemera danica]|nr:hypothetical protein B566_EDAN010350 [Ephemera danica]